MLPQVTMNEPANGKTIHSDSPVENVMLVPGASVATRSELYVHPAFVGSMETVQPSTSGDRAAA